MNSFLAIAILSISLTLSNAFAINTKNEDLIDYRLNLNLDTSSTFADDVNCTKNGPMCKNCDELVNCVRKPDGSWNPIPLTDCSASGLVCGGASCKPAQQVPSCSAGATEKFVCWMEGIFPDPGDCKKYHMCYLTDDGPEDAPITCENSDQYYYNPKTHYCDKRLPSNGVCSGFPVPTCNSIGETKPLPDNPTIYYICVNHPDNDKVLYPFQMVCPNGKTYSTSIGDCR